MDKQEAIDAICNLKTNDGWVNRYAVVSIVDQIEPEKPVVPQFVADWIELCKNRDYSLRDGLKNLSLPPEVDLWLVGGEGLFTYTNQETFARAWLDGYEVEQEQLYEVKLKANDQVLSKHYGTIGFVHSSIALSQSYIQFSKSDLEQAGFGWVFDCDGVKVVEVEE